MMSTRLTMVALSLLISEFVLGRVLVKHGVRSSPEADISWGGPHVCPGPIAAASPARRCAGISVDLTGASSRAGRHQWPMREFFGCRFGGAFYGRHPLWDCYGCC